MEDERSHVSRLERDITPGAYVSHIKRPGSMGMVVGKLLGTPHQLVADVRWLGADETERLNIRHLRRADVKCERQI